MGPKRPKTGGGASPGAAGKSWEAELVSAHLEEDDWKPSIAFVVGTKIEDEIHTEALSLAVQVPQRKLFSMVTREDIFRQIRESGNQKGKKVKDVPMYYEGFYDLTVLYFISLLLYKVKRIRIGFMNMWLKDFKIQKN